MEWGAVESLKTFNNLDVSIPLVASDLPIAEDKSIQVKAVNDLYSKLLEIPVKEK
jgi:hypothetical protein